MSVVVNAGAVLGGNEILSADFSKSRNLAYNSLESLMIAMSNGIAIKFAAFGDSTTDGNNTTGWIRNDSTGTIIPSVTGSGAPIGQSDHNLEAPNAWPVQLQTILRDMYANAGIQVFNAGYSGQSAWAGWARLNYANAVTLNPFYGKPDAVFWGFGLNDASQTPVRVNEYVSELSLWVVERLNEGVLPILLTSDSVSVQNDKNVFAGARETTEMELHFNNAIRAVGAKYNVPVLDVNSAMMLIKNHGEWTWEQIQSDQLHYGNLGHGLKAGFLASQLYSNAVTAEQGKVNKITWRDRRSNWSAKVNDILSPFDNNTGAPTTSWLIEAADYDVGQNLMTMWVYCKDVTPRLIYRGSHHTSDDVIARTLTEPNMPRIKATSTSNFAAAYYDQPIAGSGQLAMRYAMSRPFSLCDLKIGLNKVVLSAPLNATKYSFFGGWFEINPFWHSMRKNGDYFFVSSVTNSATIKPYYQTNALRDFGRIDFSKTVVEAGLVSASHREAADGSNCYSICKTGDVVEILVDCKLGISTGFTIANGAILDGDLGTASQNERSILFFNSNASLIIYELGDRYTDTASFTTLKNLGVLSWVADADGMYPLKCRIRIEQTDKSNYKISVSDGWKDSGALIGTYDTVTDNHGGTGDRRSPPIAGVVGGIFANYASNTLRSAEISQMIIRHYQ